MLIRSLRSFLQSHTPFFLMMILCIMISSLLMLFGYGLYQDYMLEQKDFDSSSKRFLFNTAAKSDDMDLDGFFLNKDLIITKSELDHCIASIPDQYLETSSLVTVYFYNPDIIMTGPSVKDICTCYFFVKDGVKYPSKETFTNRMEHPGASGRMFSDKEYTSGESVIILGKGGQGNPGETVEFYNGEKYTVIAKGGLFQEIPYDRVPSDSIVEYVSLDFDKPLSFEQYNTLKNAFSSILDRIEVWRYIPFYDEDYWMYNSAMLASLLIAVVAAFNLVVLYHYVLVRRQKSLAIFQLCGCTKGRAIRLYVAESLMLTVPCYCLSAVLYHFVLLKPFTRIFPYVDTAYSWRLYATGFGIFVTVCTIAIWILSARIVSKHSIVERKGGVV